MQLDNLDEPINITFSTPSPLNSLVTKRKTSFTANDSYIKKYDQTALHYLKCQILTEVTQEIKKCNISKCNTSSTTDIISSLKSHVHTLESEINFLRRESQEKNASVKSLVASRKLHEKARVPYKNDESNPRISPSKVIDTTEFCSCGQVSNNDGVINFPHKLLYSPGN